MKTKILIDFIDENILKNSLIRLWKVVDPGKPYGDKELLLDPCMEWEIRSVPILNHLRVYGVTDILCETDKEAINLVLETTMDPETAKRLYEEYKEKRDRQRASYCEG